MAVLVQKEVPIKHALGLSCSIAVIGSSLIAFYSLFPLLFAPSMSSDFPKLESEITVNLSAKGYVVGFTA